VNLQTSFQERYHHFHSHAQELIQHVLPYGDLQLQKKKSANDHATKGKECREFWANHVRKNKKIK
jgi:hypothetical protein